MKDLWVPVSGQVAQERKVDAIANNIANANTKGFKRDDVAFSEYLTALQKGHDEIDIPNKEFSPEDWYRSYGAENAKVKVDGTFTDFSQGQLKPTDNPFDLALDGKGFFEVYTPNGIRYTRQGSFSINPAGQLVDQNGHNVLLAAEIPEEGVASNEPPPPIEDRFFKLKGDLQDLNVNKDGTVYVNGKKIGQLSLVEFNDLHALKKEGQNLFVNSIETNISRSPASTKIHQGFVEESNVNAIGEMSELIKAHRHFETIQRAIKIYDNINGKMTNEFGRF